MRGIELKDLTKHYKDTKALEGITLTIEYGKIYGLLGRNGAGKSTMVNLISNRLNSPRAEKQELSHCAAALFRAFSASEFQ